MEQQAKKFFAVSVIGASHIKEGKPMQDYSASYAYGEYCIGVVCDGHGADKHFRSHIGSRLATEAACEKINEFITRYPNYESVEGAADEALERLKLSILAEWHDRIEKDARENPFTEEELKKASSSFETKKEYNVSQPYGSTLLAAGVTKEYYLALMIGDGAMVKILPDFSAEVVHFPGKKVYDDAPHAATDSLCESDAYSKIFAFVAPIQEKEEGLAFAMCSDGMSEAFVTDEILIKRINNYLNYYAEKGLETSEKEIGEHLKKLSALSSMKDDVSLAFATNCLELYDTSKKVPKQEERPAPEKRAGEKEQAKAQEEGAKQPAPAEENKEEKENE